MCSELFKDFKKEIKKEISKDNEELKQYGRRLCLCFEGAETAEKETIENVLEETVSISICCPK